MAKKENTPTVEQNVDNNTLLENAKAIELENSALKKQLAEMQDANANLERILANHKELQEQVQNLQAERDDLAKQIEDNKVNTESNEDVTLQIQAQLDKSQEEIVNLKAMVDKLKEQCKKMKDEPKGLVLNKFPMLLLEALCEKLSAMYKKEVTPQMIVEDYIIKYNFTEKYTEWFHPFVFSNGELVAIAQKINPEITTIKELRYALNVHER